MADLPFSINVDPPDWAFDIGFMGISGRVQNGVIALDGSATLPERAAVTVVYPAQDRSGHLTKPSTEQPNNDRPVWERIVIVQAICRQRVESD